MPSTPATTSMSPTMSRKRPRLLSDNHNNKPSPSEVATPLAHGPPDTPTPNGGNVNLANFQFMGYPGGPGWPVTPDNAFFGHHGGPPMQSPLFSPGGPGQFLVSPAAAVFGDILGGEQPATDPMHLDLSEEDMKMFNVALFDTEFAPVPFSGGGSDSIPSVPSDHFVTPPPPSSGGGIDHGPCISLDIFNSLNATFNNLKVDDDTLRSRLAALVPGVDTTKVDVVDAIGRRVGELEKSRYQEGMQAAFGAAQAQKAALVDAEARVAERDGEIVDLKAEMAELEGRLAQMQATNSRLVEQARKHDAHVNDLTVAAAYNRDWADKYYAVLQETHSQIAEAVSLRGITLEEVQPPPLDVTTCTPTPQSRLTTPMVQCGPLPRATPLPRSTPLPQLTPLPRSSTPHVTPMVKQASLQPVVPAASSLLPTPGQTPAHISPATQPITLSVAASAAIMSPSPARFTTLAAAGSSADNTATTTDVLCLSLTPGANTVAPHLLGVGVGVGAGANASNASNAATFARAQMMAEEQRAKLAAQQALRNPGGTPQQQQQQRRGSRNTLAPPYATPKRVASAALALAGAVGAPRMTQRSLSHGAAGVPVAQGISMPQGGSPWDQYMSLEPDGGN